MRNPIYIAGGVIFLGVYLLYAQPRWQDLIALVALPSIFHILVIRLEEPALRKRFGSAYQEYCQQVPRWLPRI